MASASSMFRSMAGTVVGMPTRLSLKLSEVIKRRRCSVGSNTVLLESSRIENFRSDPRAIVIGAGSRIAGQLLVFAHGGKIKIGNDCFLGEGSRIWSARSVVVGNRVLISHGVNIHDTNSHSKSARLRHEHIVDMFSNGHPASLVDVPDAEVIIDDDVWIGFNSTVLKGVRIGRGSIVGAASVVVHDVPEFSVMTGNPARRIGSSVP